MNSKPNEDGSKRHQSPQEWKTIIAEYRRPSTWRACWQIVNTVAGYVALWGLMYWSLSVSWWLTVPLALLAGGLLIRIFIIFHDCGHGSFFKSKRANDFWGFVTGLLTFTPYYHWRWEHAMHHATSGQLDRRGVGDVWTLTVKEYLESSRWKKFSYRLARNPIVLFILAPPFIFVVRQRFPLPRANQREKRSVWAMNAAIVAVALGLIAVFGFWPWFIIQHTTIAVAGSCGIWLFYVQHQFEDAYWERGEDWDFTAAAIQGSSFYKLPKVLQWFSGNIGFHHIHHLSPRIPNYNLERCHKSDPMFCQVKPVSLLDSLKSITFRMWDEKSKKLVGFGHLATLRKDRETDAPKKKDPGDLNDRR